MRRGLTVGVACALAVACGMSRLPSPTIEGHPTHALSAVPFPPPPPRVEMIPDAPRKDAVWIDGEWAWRSNRWAWQRGRWVAPPPGARFSPWTGTRDENGVFFFAEGRWRDASGRDIAAPPPLAIAEASIGPVLEPEGAEIALPPIPPERPAAVDASTGED